MVTPPFAVMSDDHDTPPVHVGMVTVSPLDAAAMAVSTSPCEQLDAAWVSA